MQTWRLRWSKAWADPRRQLGKWWLSYSTIHTAKTLLRQIQREEVAVLVLENVEAVRETPMFEDGVRIVRIRLRTPVDRREQECLDVSLSELGLGLIDIDSNQTENTQNG